MSAISHAQSEQIIETELCYFFTEHTPDDDVMYKPGVDVEGNPVEPADLNTASTFDVPEVIKFPISVKLSELLETSGISDKLEMHADLKTVQVNTKTGKTLYDGQEITPVVQNYCHDRQHHIKSGKEPTKTGPKPPRTKPANTNPTK